MYRMLLFIVIFLQSCCFDFDLFEPDCGEDIELGSFDASPNTKDFIPYRGDEVLIFEDGLGNEHQLISEDGLETRRWKLDINEICRAPIFERQEEYIDTEWRQISFEDSTGNEVFKMVTSSRKLQLSNPDSLYIPWPDSVAIYDQFELFARITRTNSFYLKIISDERHNQLPLEFKDEVRSRYWEIGDTILYGKPFKEVIAIRAADPSHGNVFYNKEKGVVAFKIDSSGYWVLK